MKSLIPFLFVGSAMASIDPNFVSISDVCPEIHIQANYSSKENFTGEVVAGYKAKKAYLARASAEALCKVQRDAQKMGLTLNIFDAYRPKKAVQFFQDWAQKPETNPEIKKLFYPKFTRLQLFERGYIAKQSSHSRGSAVDLTLMDVKTKKDLDMGSGFDYFDLVSTTETNLITKAQQENRYLLKRLMESNGFKNYAGEWWHFSYRPEPFPDQYFDFDVE